MATDDSKDSYRYGVLSPSSFDGVLGVVSLAERLMFLSSNSALAELVIPATVSDAPAAARHAAIYVSKLAATVRVGASAANGALSAMKNVTDIATALEHLQLARAGRFFAVRYAIATNIFSLYLNLIPSMDLTECEAIIKEEGPCRDLGKRTFEDAHLLWDTLLKNNTSIRNAKAATSFCEQAELEFHNFCIKAKHFAANTMCDKKGPAPLLRGVDTGVHGDSKEIAVSQEAGVGRMATASSAVPVAMQEPPQLRCHGGDAAAAAAYPLSSLHVRPPASVASRQSARDTAARAVSVLSPTARIGTCDHPELVRIVVLGDASPAATRSARHWQELVALANDIANVALATTDEDTEKYVINVRARIAQVKLAEEEAEKAYKGLATRSADVVMHHKLTTCGITAATSFAVGTELNSEMLFGDSDDGIYADAIIFSILYK